MNGSYNNRQGYQNKSAGAYVGIEGNRPPFPGRGGCPGVPPPQFPGRGGCGVPPPVPYPPFPVVPPRCPGSGDNDRGEQGPPGPTGPQGPPGRVANVSGSFSIPTQPVTVTGGSLTLGTANFTDGITLNGNSIVFPRAGTYLVTLVANMTGTGTASNVTFTATGAVAGIPSVVASDTVEDTGGDTVSPTFIIKVTGTNSSLQFNVSATVGGVVTITGGVVSAALIAPNGNGENNT